MKPTRLAIAQEALGLNNRQMAAGLGVSEEWYSKVINGHRAMSTDLTLRLDDMLRRKGLEPGSISASSGKSRIPVTGAAGQPSDNKARYGLAEPDGGAGLRRMPTRADCEELLRKILDAAEREGSPENMPVIYRLMKKHLASEFPVDE